MFDKLKEINELRKMQAELKKQKVEAESNGVKVTLNGNMQVQEISLNPELSQEDQEKALREAFNDAIMQLQKSMMSMMGGM